MGPRWGRGSGRGPAQPPARAGPSLKPPHPWPRPATLPPLAPSPPQACRLLAPQLQSPAGLCLGPISKWKRPGPPLRPQTRPPRGCRPADPPQPRPLWSGSCGGWGEHAPVGVRVSVCTSMCERACDCVCRKPDSHVASGEKQPGCVGGSEAPLSCSPRPAHAVGCCPSPPTWAQVEVPGLQLAPGWEDGPGM